MGCKGKHAAMLKESGQPCRPTARPQGAISLAPGAGSSPVPGSSFAALGLETGRSEGTLCQESRRRQPLTSTAALGKPRLRTALRTRVHNVWVAKGWVLSQIRERSLQASPRVQRRMGAT